MEAFTINIQITAEDLHQAYKIHVKKVYPVAGRLLLILGLLALAAGTGLLIYSRIRFSFINWTAGLFIAYGIFMIILHFWRVKTTGKKIAAKMPGIVQSIEYTFSENGIKVIGPDVNSDNSWSYYCRYCIMPEIILLYPDKFRFNFFAAKFFTGEQWEQLKSWIMANVPPSFK
jgi:hypothetical protein